eukprot:m.96440 g.96440  ORF g.96440 m.96440 type:complete len:1106 (-) comp12465_c0_seq1:27-3344(-)
MDEEDDDLLAELEAELDDNNDGGGNNDEGGENIEDNMGKRTAEPSCSRREEESANCEEKHEGGDDVLGNDGNVEEHTATQSLGPKSILSEEDFVALQSQLLGLRTELYDSKCREEALTKKLHEVQPQSSTQQSAQARARGFLKGVFKRKEDAPVTPQHNPQLQRQDRDDSPCASCIKLQKKNKKLKEDVKELRGSLSSLQAEVELYRENGNELSRSMKAAQVDLDDQRSLFKRTMEGISERNRELTSQLRAIKMEKQGLAAKYLDSNKERDSLRQQLDELKKAMEEEQQRQQKCEISSIGASGTQQDKVNSHDKQPKEQQKQQEEEDTMFDKDFQRETKEEDEGEDECMNNGEDEVEPIKATCVVGGVDNGKDIGVGHEENGDSLDKNKDGTASGEECSNNNYDVCEKSEEEEVVGAKDQTVYSQSHVNDLLEKHKKEANELSNKLQASDTLINDLSEELEQHREKIVSLVGDKDIAESKVLRLQTTIEEEQRDGEQLKVQIRTLNGVVEEKERELKTEKDKRGEQQTSFAALVVKCNKYESLCRERGTKIEQLELDIANLRSSISKCNKEKDEGKGTITHLKTALQSKIEELSNMRKKVDAKTSESKDEKQKYLEKQQKLLDEKQKVKQLQQKLSDHKQQVTVLTKSLETTKKQLNSSSQENDRLKRKLNEMEQNASTCDALKTKLSSMYKQMAALESENKLLVNASDEMSQKMQECTQELQQANKRIAEQEEANVSATAHTETKEREMKETEKKVQSLYEEIKMLTADLEESEKRVVALSSDKEDQEMLLEEMKREKNMLETEQHQQELNWKEKFRILEESNDEVVQKLSDLEENTVLMTKKHQKTVKDLSKQLQQMKKKMTTLATSSSEQLKRTPSRESILQEKKEASPRSSVTMSPLSAEGMPSHNHSRNSSITSSNSFAMSLDSYSTKPAAIIPTVPSSTIHSHSTTRSPPSSSSIKQNIARTNSNMQASAAVKVNARELLGFDLPEGMDVKKYVHKITKKLRKTEKKVEGLEQTLQNKSKLLSSYMERDERGQLLPEQKKQKRSSSSFLSRKKEAEIAKEANAKLHSLLEDTMTKNMQLTTTIDILSKELQQCKQQQKQ